MNRKTFVAQSTVKTHQITSLNVHSPGAHSTALNTARLSHGHRNTKRNIQNFIDGADLKVPKEAEIICCVEGCERKDGSVRQQPLACIEVVPREQPL